MIILRQQYRRQPSWSMASLEDHQQFVMCTIALASHTRLARRRQGAGGTAPTGHQRPSQDLARTQIASKLIAYLAA